MIHESADVQSAAIGADTRIWQNVIILPNAVIGARCNICANCFVENNVVIGNDVTIKCGVSIWDGVSIEDRVFVGPAVAFTNDKFPRSRHWPEEYAKTIVHEGASIGANATILPIEIGKYAMVGAGAVVTRNVPPYAIVVGNPAKVVGYVDAAQIFSDGLACENSAIPSGGTSAKIVRIPVFSDQRGDLNVVEIEKMLPFAVRRLFYTYNVSSADVRGEHAHKKCDQFLIAVKGSVSVIVDNGHIREEYELNNPSTGLYLPAGLWGIQYKHSQDCVLLVLASMPYDDSDYIRDYDEYLEFVEEKTQTKR